MRGGAPSSGHHVEASTGILSEFRKIAVVRAAMTSHCIKTILGGGLGWAEIGHGA